MMYNFVIYLSILKINILFVYNLVYTIEVFLYDTSISQLNASILDQKKFLIYKNIL